MARKALNGIHNAARMALASGDPKKGKASGPIAFRSQKIWK